MSRQNWWRQEQTPSGEQAESPEQKFRRGVAEAMPGELASQRRTQLVTFCDASVIRVLIGWKTSTVRKVLIFRSALTKRPTADL